MIGNNAYKKTYEISNFLCSEEELQRRTSLIEMISKKISSVPEVKFFYSGKSLIYSQKYIPKKEDNFNKSALLQTAEDLNTISGQGLIHGDLNRKNIIFNSNSFLIIDWEPCLKQRKNGKDVLLYTPPYISIDNLRKGILDSDSDKIGWYFYILRLRRLLNPNHIAFMYKKRMLEHKPILPFSENDLSDMDFISITNTACSLKDMSYLRVQL